ncbi:MAG: glycine/betaine ABC transporter substrate-binding protein [Peptostreptococcaceae bacterium]|jgi:glycine betaine/choline ABC-type transport system substrate-binding protein|nr:glycine/betaine ABC transporter substrate-binding protein [Peptostreptococcaceae bacterium]
MKNRKILIILYAIIIIFIISCSKKEIESKPDLVVATKPFTEQYILGEILKILIEENTNLNVELKKDNIRDTILIHQELLEGNIDIYPEYTSTAWVYILKKDPIKNSDELYDKVTKIYKEDFDVTWLGLYGFNNSYSLAMRRSLADNLSINTYSDLASKSDKLIFGAEHDFYTRDDGFTKLKEVYNFNFKEELAMEIKEKYNSLRKDTSQVIDVFTTDSNLKDDDIKVLKDDRYYFAPYHCGTVIRDETLTKYPKLEYLLKQLNYKISEREMIEMNYKVEKEDSKDEDVAREFLKSKKLIN